MYIIVSHMYYGTLINLWLISRSVVHVESGSRPLKQRRRYIDVKLVALDIY